MTTEPFDPAMVVAIHVKGRNQCPRDEPLIHHMNTVDPDGIALFAGNPERFLALWSDLDDVDPNAELSVLFMGRLGDRRWVCRFERCPDPTSGGERPLRGSSCRREGLGHV